MIDEIFCQIKCILAAVDERYFVTVLPALGVHGTHTESVKTTMSRLFTNNTMSFLSLSGWNYGKVAFGDSAICSILMGMDKLLFHIWQMYVNACYC